MMWLGLLVIVPCERKRKKRSSYNKRFNKQPQPAILKYYFFLFCFVVTPIRPARPSLQLHESLSFISPTIRSIIASFTMGCSSSKFDTLEDSIHVFLSKESREQKINGNCQFRPRSAMTRENTTTLMEDDDDCLDRSCASSSSSLLVRNGKPQTALIVPH